LEGILRTQKPDANPLYDWEEDMLYVRADISAEIIDRAMKATYAVVILRILLTPVFFYAFMWNFTGMSIFLYIAAFASGIVDGRLAEREGIILRSTLEAYLDPIADFVFILMSFYAFTLREVFPVWLLVVLVFMFLFFVISSNNREPLYDPVGKYYGVFLMTAIGLTLLFPTDPVSNWVLLLIIAYTLGLVIYRMIFLWRNRMRTQD
jgi:phosphatidylglycerophosphate synthase